MDAREAFAVLRNLSVRFAKEGNVESLKALREGVDNVLTLEEHNDDGWTSCINDLKEYLLLPVIVILRTKEPCGWSLEEEAVSFIRVVLEHSSAEDFKFFQEVFSQLIHVITHRTEPSKVRETSEECKSAVLGGVRSLVERCGSEVRQQVYGQAFRPQLGHAVHLLLALATQEKSIAIKTEALVTLGALGQHTAYPHMTQSEQHLLSTTFTNFLPGVSTALTKVATAGDTQNHKVTVTAVDVWSHLIVMVMQDSYLSKQVDGFGESDTLRKLRTSMLSVPKENTTHQRQIDSKSTRKSKFELPEPDEEKVFARPLIKVEVTAEWVTKTSQRLQLLVESLSGLVTHSHWRVRLSLVHWAHNIITHCTRSLSGSMEVVVEVLAALSYDDMHEVSSVAQEALHSLGSALDGSHTPLNNKEQITPQEISSKKEQLPKQDTGQDTVPFQHPLARRGFVAILQEQIFSLSTRLPRISKQQDDARTLATLHSLSGVMGLLRGQLQQVLRSQSHSHRLLLALSCLLTLDTSLPHLLQERTIDLDVTGECMTHLPKGRFKHFGNLAIVSQVGRICELMARHGDLLTVMDLCLEWIHASHTRKETLLILTLILQGIEVRNEEERSVENEREHVVRSVLECVLCPDIFDASLYVRGDTTLSESASSPVPSSQTLSTLKAINSCEGESVSACRSNVMLVWCALDLIGACAHLLGTNFQGFLSTVLCPVMEKAGEANIVVSTAATNTLRQVAIACGHHSIGKLIQTGVPYFWYPLSFRLKRLSQYPSAPLVLQVCLHHAQLDVLVFIEELVDEVLATLDTHHTAYSIPLIRVLMVYVSAAARHEAALTKTCGEDTEVSGGGTRVSGEGTKTDGDGKKTSGDGGIHECLKATSRNHSSAGTMYDTTKQISRENISEGQGNITVTRIHQQSMDELGAVTNFLLSHHEQHQRIKQCLEENHSDMEENLNDLEENPSDIETLQNHVRESAESEKEISDSIGESSEEEKKAVPRHIELVVNVMERCSHLLFVNEPKSQVLLLEVILRGCDVLARWEDQRLPVFHKLWKPLMLRLKEKDYAVVTRVVEVVAAMLITSGQFLQKRCLQEFLPPLVAFLRSQGVVSQGKDRTSGYYLTPVYRAQLRILTKLPVMMECLAPGPIQVAEVVDVVAEYCHTDQPNQLRLAAQDLLKILAHKHPHQVWLTVTRLLAPGVISPPSPLLPSIRMPASNPRELPKEVLDLYSQLW